MNYLLTDWIQFSRIFMSSIELNENFVIKNMWKRSLAFGIYNEKTSMNIVFYYKFYRNLTSIIEMNKHFNRKTQITKIAILIVKSLFVISKLYLQ